MKKVLIVILSVLMLLSFSSCQKDNSEEVIAALEDYYKTNNILGKTTSTVSYTAMGDGSVNQIISQSSVKETDLENCLRKLGVITGSDTVSEVKSASGSITGIESDANTSLTYTGITIKYTVGEDTTEREFTFSGTVKSTLTVSGEKTKSEAAISLTINNTAYSVSIAAEDGKATSVTVNGKAVDPRLLNTKMSNLG